MSITIEELYKDYELLLEVTDFNSEEAKNAYNRALSAVNAGPSEKRLASQLISRYFLKFPDQADKSISAVLRLCNDTGIEIRKQAIRDLPTFCKGNKSYVLQVTEALAQLLTTSDTSEYNIISMSLSAVFVIDPGVALRALFNNVNQDNDEAVRAKTIHWMETKMKQLPSTIWTKPIEEYMLAEIKNVMYDVTGSEFMSLMRIASGLNYTSSVRGRQELMDIVIAQAMLDQKFDGSCVDSIDRLMQCAQQALVFVSKHVHSTPFVSYLIDQVLADLDVVPATTTIAGVEGTATEETVHYRFELLKILAEMSAFAPDLTEMERRMTIVFNTLVTYMPLPPETKPADENSLDDQPANDDDQTANGQSEGAKEPPAPKLEYSVVECLLYTFHELGKLKPDFLIGDNDDLAKPGLHCSLAEFRRRLQYFAHNCNMQIKKLRLALEKCTPEDLKNDENKLKVVALKTTTSITTMIRDMLHKPPQFKAIVTLSWKPIMKRTASTEGATDAAETGAATAKNRRNELRRYQPPTGRFRREEADYGSSNRGWRGRGGRGGGRGRRW